MGTIEADTRNPSSRLTLSGQLDIRTANELHSQLTEFSANQQNRTIDCSAIDALDASCMQLLIAAKRGLENTTKLEAMPGTGAARWFAYAGLSHHLVLSEVEKFK